MTQRCINTIRTNWSSSGDQFQSDQLYIRARRCHTAATRADAPFGLQDFHLIRWSCWQQMPVKQLDDAQTKYKKEHCLCTYLSVRNSQKRNIVYCYLILDTASLIWISVFLRIVYIIIHSLIIVWWWNFFITKLLLIDWMNSFIYTFAIEKQNRSVLWIRALKEFLTFNRPRIRSQQWPIELSKLLVSAVISSAIVFDIKIIKLNIEKYCCVLTLRKRQRHRGLLTSKNDINKIIK